MGVRRYYYCDECEEREIAYAKLDESSNLKSKYTELMDDCGPFFDEQEGWVIKAEQDPSDPIAIRYEYYCPQCVRSEEFEDSGDYRSERLK
jgi:hypothetical protein